MTPAEKAAWDAAFTVARRAVRAWGGKDGMGVRLAEGVLEKIAAAKRAAEKPKAPAKPKSKAAKPKRKAKP